MTFVTNPESQNLSVNGGSLDRFKNVCKESFALLEVKRRLVLCVCALWLVWSLWT